MHYLVAGGTGFVGSALVASLVRRDHSVTLLSRRTEFPRNETGVSWLSWNSGEAEISRAVERADCIVNLAGESVFARWNDRRKESILRSRLDTTQALVEAIGRAKKKPGAFVSASAVGYYGPRGDEELTERSAPGIDFLADVCRRWEAEAMRASSEGVRTTTLRLGLVLGNGGGALGRMLLPFRLGLGGPIGSGRQWVSWIHLMDLIRLIEWAATNSAASGACNATAPNPVRMCELAQTLGRVLHRPAFLPVPGPALRLILGEMADMVLTGQKVMPRKAAGGGFRFEYETLGAALTGLVRTKSHGA